MAYKLFHRLIFMSKTRDRHSWHALCSRNPSILNNAKRKLVAIPPRHPCKCLSRSTVPGIEERNEDGVVGGLEVCETCRRGECCDGVGAGAAREEFEDRGGVAGPEVACRLASVEELEGWKFEDAVAGAEGRRGRAVYAQEGRVCPLGDRFPLEF